MDAADDDDILINFTLGNPLGRRPPPPPNASHADSPSLNPPETFYEWMQNNLANNSDLKKLFSDKEREKEKHKKKNTKTQNTITQNNYDLLFMEREVLEQIIATSSSQHEDGLRVKIGETLKSVDP